MSFATVYNTLDALVSAGLCTPRALSPGATRFDPNTAPHHHAVCDGCGLVIDLPIDSKLNPRAAHVPQGFAVRAVEQIVRGSCAACAPTCH
jgi:Fur family peroxide stress response transcriptional regulator